MTRKYPKIDAELVISASQLGTAADCHRKRWLKARGLKEPPKAHFDEGTTLHSVFERWGNADAQGNDPQTGQPVDLYPSGWDSTVDPMFAQFARKMSDFAIREGVIIREPGAEYEKEIILDVLPTVKLLGYIDVAHDYGIDDIKTTKSTQYVKTEDQLAADIQMMVYAYWWFQEHPEAQVCRLRHFTFLKDFEKPKIYTPSVLVTREDVESHWTEVVVPLAQDMLDLHRKFTDVTHWRQVTGPSNKGVCRKYGGCAYARVCGGLESPVAYLTKQNRAAEKAETIQETPKVDITKKLLARRAPVTPPTPAAEAPVAPPTPAVAPVAPAVVEPATKVEAALAKDAAPWANPACRPCSGSGWTPDTGLPCKACDAWQRLKGQKTSADYSQTAVPLPQAVQEPTAAPVQVAQPAKAPKPKKERKPKAVEAEAEAEGVVVEPIGETIAAIAETIEGALTPSPQAAIVRQGDPILLLVNAAPLRSSVGIDLHGVFAEITAKLAKLSEVGNFLDLDPWKRKDLLAQHVQAWARGLKGGEILVAVGGGQDFKIVVDTLRALSTITVIQGVL